MNAPLSKVSRYVSAAKAASFHEARKEFQSDVFAFVSRRIKPTEEAEDIVSQVFVDAYRHWHRRRGEPKWWLLGIARRKVCDAHRKNKHATWTIRDEDIAANAMSDFVTQGEALEAYRIVHQLPPDQRDAFLLQVLEEMSIEEIGKVMGRSTASTNGLLQRARERIRKLASKTHPQGETQ